MGNKTAEEAAGKMEEMITKIKSKANHVAISSVTERFDHKVAASKINKFNSVSSLCDKHKIDFINNSNITKEMLNGSNLHLNQVGDRVLGKSFCDYLRSIRVDYHTN